MLSLENICPHTQVAKGFLQLIPRIQLSLFGSTNINFEEYPQDFFQMNINLYLYP